MFKFISDYIEGRTWRTRAKHLRAVKKDLVEIRSMLADAIATGYVIKTKGARQFIRCIGHGIQGVEHHIDGMIETDEQADQFRSASAAIPLAGEAAGFDLGHARVRGVMGLAQSYIPPVAWAGVRWGDATTILRGRGDVGDGGLRADDEAGSLSR